MNPQQHLGRIKIIIFVYIAAQAIIIIMYWKTQFVDELLFLIIDMGINSFPIVSVLIAKLYLNIKFSGSFFQSLTYEKKAKRFSNLVLFWAFMRIPQLVINLLLLNYKNKIFDFLIGKLEISTFWQIFFIFIGVGDMLITTVLPFLAAMQKQFVSLFLIDFSD